MLKRVSRAAVLVAALATGAPVWAETPMTPSAPDCSSGPAAKRPVEHRPAMGRPAGRPHAKMPSHPDHRERRAGGSTRAVRAPTRTSRQGRRLARARSWSTRQLNYQQFYGGWSGASMPNYRGYGPAPYSNSGD